MLAFSAQVSSLGRAVSEPPRKKHRHFGWKSKLARHFMYSDNLAAAGTDEENKSTSRVRHEYVCTYNYAENEARYCTTTRSAPLRTTQNMNTVSDTR